VTTRKPLRTRLRAFVRAYVETGNATESMRRIGFTGSRPDVAGSKLLAKPRVREAIQEFELTMQGQVRQRIYANLRRLEQIRDFDPLWGTKPIADWPDEVRMTVQGIDVEERFEEGAEKPTRILIKKYRTAPKIEAAKLIMQYQRILDDRPVLPPIQVNVGAHVTVALSNDPIEASLQYERLMLAPQPALPELPAPVAVT
jgi:hypothetical protein